MLDEYRHCRTCVRVTETCHVTGLDVHGDQRRFFPFVCAVSLRARGRNGVRRNLHLIHANGVCHSGTLLSSSAGAIRSATPSKIKHATAGATDACARNFTAVAPRIAPAM